MKLINILLLANTIAAPYRPTVGINKNPKIRINNRLIPKLTPKIQFLLIDFINLLRGAEKLKRKPIPRRGIIKTPSTYFGNKIEIKKGTAVTNKTNKTKFNKT